MSTVVIDIDDKSSVKLFMELAKKMHFKARVLTETQKEDAGLLTLINERIDEEPLSVDSALSILRKQK